MVLKILPSISIRLRVLICSSKDFDLNTKIPKEDYSDLLIDL